MTGEVAAFWILAGLSVAAALGVVLLRNVFRAVLVLIICFLAVAGLFVTLSADFLAGAQVLIYVGAVAALIVTAIMLTREVERGNRAGRFAWPALIAAALFTGALIWASLTTNWPRSSAAPPEETVSILGNLLFSEGGLVLVVEMSALLIIAAVIGAASIARDK